MRKQVHTYVVAAIGVLVLVVGGGLLMAPQANAATFRVHTEQRSCTVYSAYSWPTATVFAVSPPSAPNASRLPVTVHESAQYHYVRHVIGGVGYHAAQTYAHGFTEYAATSTTRYRVQVTWKVTSNPKVLGCN